uniref:CXC domain-containing protein n=1 Tax=Hucho hucho TaxID=62062 RepID=A0A4W5L6V8_9TELE
MSCGHHCKDLCHPGHCEDKCSHRVKLKCPCKRIKKELLCYNARDDQAQVECNEACKALRRKANEVTHTHTLYIHTHTHTHRFMR